MEASTRLYNYGIKDKQGRLFCVIQAPDSQTALARVPLVEELVQIKFKEPIAEHYLGNFYSVPWFSEYFFLFLKSKQS